jgi:hypothetical protein
MGKRQIRYSGAALSEQLTKSAGKPVQLVLATGGTIRVNVLNVSSERLEIADFTHKKKLIPFAQVVELVIDQETPY